MYQAGLILEGGGMRGVYTAGVLDAFLEEKKIFPNIPKKAVEIHIVFSYNVR